MKSVAELVLYVTWVDIAVAVVGLTVLALVRLKRRSLRVPHRPRMTARL